MFHSSNCFQELPVNTPKIPIAAGPFNSSVESLKEYQCPEWFRDAKFGIWSHWGPQAVPRQGDWYARKMYIEGDPHYKHHFETWGHPSKHGYKDIIPMWKAEKWDPEALMALYAKAGAKYFVSMGVHHDNFDLWNSKHQQWNSVKMGPKRDVVGEWKKAATRHGLHFGVSEHLGASYAWFASSHGADKAGEYAGVPYDGANPEYHSLYHPNHDEPFNWGRTWYANNPQWHAHWFDRMKDLVDQYQPDLLYSDGGLPFEETGRSLVAHYYNANQAAHGGKVEAVYNHKDMGTGEFIREAGAQDVERGVLKGINPLPWQTDTSIGDWYYSDGFKYKTTDQIIHMLADIVSKNGNMLLNVVQYADGSLPPEPQKFLEEMAVWIAVNGDAIYGTRPWKLFGEGPTDAVEGHFKEDTAYTAQDIRFTTKAGSLYAITLGVPQGEVRIKSLGQNAKVAEGIVASVRLLGSDEVLKWTQEPAALVIKLPPSVPTQHAAVLQIGFENQPTAVMVPEEAISK
ncbi:MAG: alpha-L-fucosidase [Burkholderiales bacterium]|nr:alpha-L-fucosidase [Phycisphaerae bacterium]